MAVNRLSNFGVFATPERNLVFDINDFGETHPGPWEWDLKRLAASAVVARRENGFSDDVNHKLAMAVSRTCRQAMLRLADLRTLDVWYFQVEADQIMEVLERSCRQAKKSARRMFIKARTRTQAQTLEKLTQEQGRRSPDHHALW